MTVGPTRAAGSTPSWASNWLGSGVGEGWEDEYRDSLPPSELANYLISLALDWPL